MCAISSVCCIQGVPEGLEAHAEWARERLLPLKRKKKQALLSRDPYEGRPYSLQQRLRTGSTPVVEASPQLSIDDTGACTPAGTPAHPARLVLDQSMEHDS